MSEHDAQPFDDRHEPRPVNPFAFTGDHTGNDTQVGFALPERGKSQGYHPGGYVPSVDAPGSGSSTAHGLVGLSFSLDGISSMLDIGRHFGQPDALADFHEVDLRTILAHLDSAARSITRELEARGLGGRR